jgi:alpha/beta superfamily hydrolase
MTPGIIFRAIFVLAVASICAPALAQSVVDIPTRPGVTERMLVIAPPAPKAAVILFAGGHGGLQISSTGTIKWGDGNFVIRTRQQFADQGLFVVVIDAPSDRQAAPYLGGYRQTPSHLEDVKAAIAWVRERAKVPVWLIGTSRGTQSVAFIATELTDSEGPDGIVLTSTILTDDTGRAVPKMPLDKIKIPVLVVHHEQDGCKHCAFGNIPSLMDGLSASRKKELIPAKGGQSRGDPCEPQAYHGFNGIERDVVAQTVTWILAN